MTQFRPVLLHISRTERLPIDPATVYLIEGAGDHSLIRLRTKTPLEDVRSIGALSARFESSGFVRIHREYSVNISRIRRIRLQEDGRDWAVQLDPPVNRILPVARDAVTFLWTAFGE